MRKLFTVLLGCAMFSVAAQDSLQSRLLKEIVFSASRMDQPVIDIPRSVSVITSATIERSVYSSVGDLLSLQEGIYTVGANQTPGTNQTLFLRGAAGNQSVILIDGKRINDPSSPNAAIDLSEISLTNVERIEIIRGSHTTMYGGSAVGGVINIITKKAINAGVHGRAAIQGGSVGDDASSLLADASVTYQAPEGFYVNGSLWHQTVQGLDATVKRPGPGFTTNDADDFRKTDFSLKTGVSKEKLDASISFKNIKQRADIDNGAFADDNNNYLDFKRRFFDADVNWKFNDQWALRTLAGLTFSERFNENDSSVIDASGNTDKSYFKGRYNGRLITAETQLNYASQRFSAVTGLGYFGDNMSFDTYYFSNGFGFPFELVTDYDSIETASSTVYLFSKANYTVNAFTISGGARVSNHSVFGNFVSFELNPSFRIGESLVYASASSGYNAPSLYQLYDPSIAFGGFASRGNSALEPEKSMSFEVGFKHQFASASFVTISAFQTDVKDAIEFVYLWNGAVAIADLDFDDYRGDRYLNVARQRTAGLEVSFEQRFSQKVSFQGNATLLKGRITARAADLSRAQVGDNHVQLYNYGDFISDRFETETLSRRPRLVGNAVLKYSPADRFNLSMTYRLAGSRFDVAYDVEAGPFGALRDEKIKRYNLIDLNAAYRFGEHLLAALKVENVLDEEYAEIQGYRTRGRSLYLKLAYNW